MVEPRQTLGGSTAVISIHVSFTICYVDIGYIGVNAHVVHWKKKSIYVCVHVHGCVCPCVCP